MSKGGVIILIVAALVFTGLGFVIGQVVVAAGNSPGSEGDPTVVQSYVDKLVGEKTSALQNQIDDLYALVEAGGVSPGAADPPPGGGTTDPGTPSSNPTKVKVTSDSVNVRSSASTGGEIVGTVSAGTELTYISTTQASDGAWYHVRLSSGVEGYVAGWLCGDPY